MGSTSEAAASPPVLAGESSPVLAGGSPPGLAVPRQTLQRDGEQTVAFERTAPGRSERRDVLVGRIAGDFRRGGRWARGGATRW
ncbi:MAG TPA: hypothetical protein VMT85_14175 [Thermoanaerobaculia bacterium]|nr:hypothetical protein [Thermoanaerobaculia bacterium]